jgi:hypothetical protein
MSLLSTIASVLLVGHSLIGHENPRMLQQLLAARGGNALVEAQIIIGSNLIWNWDHSHQAEGVNGRAMIPARKYDVVILTEAIPLENHLEWSDTVGLAGRWHDLARQANPDARVFLQETWHSLLSGTGADVPYDDKGHIPWRVRLDQDLPKWQGVVDAVNDAGGNMALIPGGQAMARLHDEIKAGTVPGMSDISDVFVDTVHPNDLGFYYMSLVQFAAITGEDPTGLPRRLRGEYQPYRTPTPEQALRLQEIAWEVVQDHLPDNRSRADVEQQPQAPPVDEAVVAQVDLPEPPGPAPSETLLIPTPIGPQPMAINLAEVSDWSVQQPFLDVFKTARTWIGHLPGQWGGVTYEDLKQAGYLDQNGWPLAKPPELGSVGTAIFTDMPEAAVSLAGRYWLSFEGDGIVEVQGRVGNVRYEDGRVSFDYVPGPGSVEIRIQRSDRLGTGDYVRNIKVIKEEHLAAYEAGKRFNPDWLAKVDGFEVLRMMDWMRTNNSTISNWEQRPKPDDFSFSIIGVPVEVMVKLANELDADPWFNIPHLADDDFVRNFARIVREELNSDRRAYVEYSNEVWNWAFLQTHWADAQAKARWGEDGNWMQFYGGRATEIALILSEIFSDEAEARLVNVISSQTGWLGLEDSALEAPPWRAEVEGRPAPGDFFDAYAVTGYFGGMLGTDQRVDLIRSWISESRAQTIADADAEGLTGAERKDYITRHQFDMAAALAGAELRSGFASGEANDTLKDLLERILPYHKNVADAYDLDLIMYEGGTHIVGHGPIVDDPDLTAFFTHLNYAPEMGALYDELIAGWYNLGGTLFNAYADIYPPNKWGSWGHLRHLDDDNPRWDALRAVQ